MLNKPGIILFAFLGVLIFGAHGLLSRGSDLPNLRDDQTIRDAAAFLETKEGRTFTGIKNDTTKLVQADPGILPELPTENEVTELFLRKPEAFKEWFQARTDDLERRPDPVAIDHFLKDIGPLFARASLYSDRDQKILKTLQPRIDQIMAKSLAEDSPRAPASIDLPH